MEEDQDKKTRRQEVSNCQEDKKTRSKIAITEEKLNVRKVSSINVGSSRNRLVGLEAGGHTGDGFRENPKKTQRQEDSSKDTSVCEECGEGFPSPKALFDHRRCHAKKLKVCNSLEDASCTKGQQKLVLDTHSGIEAAIPKRESSATTTKTNKSCSSVSLANASTSVSDIEQKQEELEVADDLLKQPTGVEYPGRLSSVAESSNGRGIFPDPAAETYDIVNLVNQDLPSNAGTSYGSKERKEYPCTKCSKVFASKQAKGGHMRSHKGKDSRKTRDLLDLNLPAPSEEETDDHE